MKLSTIGLSATAGSPPVAARSDDGRNGRAFGSMLDKFEPAAPDSAGASTQAAAHVDGTDALAATCATPAAATLPGTLPPASAKGAAKGADAGADAGRVIDLAALASRAADAGDPAETSTSASVDVADLLDAVSKETQRRAGEQADAGDATATLSGTVLPFSSLPPSLPNATSGAGSTGTGAAATSGLQTSGDGLATGSVSLLGAASAGASTIDSQIEPGSVNVVAHLGFSRGLDAARAEAASSSAAARASDAATVPDGSTHVPTLPGSTVDSLIGLETAHLAGTPLANPRDLDPSRGKQASLVSGGTSDKGPISTLSPGAPTSSTLSANDPAPVHSAQLGSAEAKGTDRPVAEVAVSSQAAAASSDAVAPGLSMAPSVTPLIARVAEGVAALAASPAAAPAEATGLQIAPAKTMILQLSPDGLGTLSVRLHVSGRALDVHLEASDSQTAVLIDRDRSSLTNALSGRDYQVQTLTVTSGDATMQGNNHAERGTDPGSANANSSDQRGGGPSGDRTGRGAPRQDDGRSPNRRSDAPVLDRGGSSSLFV